MCSSCFPMISGYYTALERTMFVEEVDPADAHGSEGVAVVALGHVHVVRPVLTALGLRLGDAGLTALLIGVGPLFIVLTEWAWPGGLRPTVRTAAALLCLFASCASAFYVERVVSLVLDAIRPR